MAVISITVLESEEQVVAGIPKTVTLSTNIPTTIFFTLDGSQPTIFSDIYVSSIYLPFDSLIVTLKILAHNGVDVDTFVTETYITNMLNNARLPHSATDAQSEISIPDLYPFGTNPLQPNGIYLNPGEAGVTVDNPDTSAASTGFDGSGNQNAFTNAPYNTENYSILYSTTDNIGQTGLGVGNLPARVKVELEKAAPEFVDQSSNLFDPRASVIFQDTRTENPNDPPHINRQFFSLENSERIRDGNNFFNTGLDSPPTTGAFLRSHFNPTDKTITYYYYDSIANKWIISKTVYAPTGTWNGNLSGVVAPQRQPGSNFVFQWLPFTRRVLF